MAKETIPAQIKKMLHVVATNAISVPRLLGLLSHSLAKKNWDMIGYSLQLVIALHKLQSIMGTRVR